jgi:gliding motility-associated-like protein/uncharacterized repeat protein (TIGR01451 family)
MGYFLQRLKKRKALQVKALFSLFFSSLMGLLGAPNLAAQDLSLAVQSSATTAQVGSELTFRTVVRNDAATAVSGVIIRSLLPRGTSLVAQNVPTTAYSAATGLWTIGSISATTPETVLELRVRVESEGVIFSEAEIINMTETDADSRPNNALVTEDDWSSACSSVPVRFGAGQAVDLLVSAPLGYAQYQWFRNGAPVSGAQFPQFSIRDTGSYSFTATTGALSCPAGSCCPIVVEKENCLTPDISVGNPSYAVCAFSAFNLQQIVVNDANNVANGVVTYHLTAADAVSGSHAISPIFNVIGSTRVWIRKTDASLTCSDTTSVTIQATQLRADFVVLEPFCNDAEMTILFTGIASPWTELNYNLNGATIVRRSAATATRPAGDTTIVRWANFGAKLIKLNLNEGSCTDTKQTSVLIRKSPTTIIANNDTTICRGESVRLYGTAGILDCVYEWSPTMGLSSSSTAYTTVNPPVSTTYTLSVMDINGCMSQDTVRINLDTQPPVFVGIPADVTLNCGQTVVNASVTTTQGFPVQFVEMRQNGTCAENYTIVRTWTSTDNCGNTATASQRILFQDTQAPVFVNVPANVTVSCSRIPEATQPTANDNCTANVRIVFTETRQAGSCAGNATLLRLWIATDNCGNATSAQQIVEIRDNEAPVFAGVPQNITLECGAPLPTQAPTATDNCGTPVVRATTQETAFSACDKSVNRLWIATDACGNETSAQQVVTYRDNTAPILVGLPANLTLDCSSPIPSAPNLSANDACDAAPRVVGSETRDTNGCTVTIVRNWIATDQCGNMGSGQQTITIRDMTAPVLTAINPRLQGLRNNDTLVMNCDQVTIFRAEDMQVTDNCDPNPTVVFEDIAIRRGTYLRDGYSMLMECRWVATDRCGNTTIFKMFFKVVDSIAPVLSNIPTDITVNSTAQIPQVAGVTATDNCDTNPVISFTTDSIAIPNTCNYILVRKWRATDEAGNVSNLGTQRITVIQPPMEIKVLPFPATCARNDGSASLLPQSGINYAWSNGRTGATVTGLSAGVYTVTATKGNCSKILNVTIVDSCTVVTNVCRSFIDETVVASSACEDGDSADVCISIPRDRMQEFTVSIGNVAYTSSLLGCNYDTAFSYTYFALPGRGATGPYRLENWTINGTAYNVASVQNMSELLAEMNRLDPTGNWYLNLRSFSFVGGDKRKVYGAMRVAKVSDGAFGIMNTSSSQVPKGTRIRVPQGRNLVIFRENASGCKDTVTSLVTCNTARTVVQNLKTGAIETTCLLTNRLLGARLRVEKLSGTTGTSASHNLVLGTACVQSVALNVGDDRSTYIVRDEFGLTDTTHIFTYVTAAVRAVKSPIALDDKAETRLNTSVDIQILDNDTLNGNTAEVRLVTQPKFGSVQISATMSLVYTPNDDYCGGTTEQLQYALCGVGGACDTATVYVKIACDKLVFYKGFSPNNDGINDVFTIEGVTLYPDNSLTIYNRWGTEVYEKKNYQNTWNGTWADARPLPDGTYFYVFDDGKGNKHSGYVQIQR